MLHNLFQRPKSILAIDIFHIQNLWNCIENNTDNSCNLKTNGVKDNIYLTLNMLVQAEGHAKSQQKVIMSEFSNRVIILFNYGPPLFNFSNVIKT